MTAHEIYYYKETNFNNIKKIILKGSEKIKVVCDILSIINIILKKQQPAVERFLLTVNKLQNTHYEIFLKIVSLCSLLKEGLLDDQNTSHLIEMCYKLLGIF